MTYTEPPTESMRPVPPPRPRTSPTPWVVTGVAVLVAVGAVLVALGVVPNPLHHRAPRSGVSALIARDDSIANQAPTPPSTFVMTGTITLSGTPGQDYVIDSDGSCAGTGGFSDINAGVAVTVGDSTGRTVAIGSLGDGTASLGCELPWSVPDVPAGLSEYTVTISHRGTQVVQGDQATLPVTLTLGS
jgi:hypothetical protein